MSAHASGGLRELAATGAALGAAAGGTAALYDLASTVFWLSSLADQARLAVALVAVGAASGALVGAVLAPALGGGVAPRRAAIATRVAAVVTLPLGLVAYALFSGGHARRLPALWALRPLAWLVLTAGATTALTAGARAIAALRRRATRWRVAGAAALLGVAQALHGVDHRFFPRLYEYLHVGLGVLTALACAGAAVLLAPRRPSRAAGLGVLALAAVALPLVWRALDRWDNVRAEVFGVHAPYVRHVVLAVESVRRGAGPDGRDALMARRSRYAREQAAARASGDETGLPRAPGAHVLLVTIDALRADRLGRRVDGASLTPTLDALAARGVVFARAYTQAPHSSYALSSLHTSEYLHETVPLGQLQPLPTLPDALAARGYHTAALYTHGVFFTEGERLTVYRDRDFGCTRGDHVDRRAPAQAEAAMRELDDWVRRDEPPGFLWVHFFDTHEPYGGTGATSQARYDDAARTVDAALGRLLAHARARLARDLIVAVTADHGEEFGEHGGVYHGSALYDEQVRVPLVLAAPGLAPARVEAPVELIDVAPTLLALADVPRPRTMRGRDLRALARDATTTRAPARLVFGAVNTRTMVVRWPHKLIADLRYGVRELYDLARDPGETTNLAGAQPALADDLRGELLGWIDVLGRTSARPTAIARGRLGDHGAHDELLALARDTRASGATRREAIEALAGFGDATTAADLAPLLRDPADDVADLAASVLGSRGDRAALPRLLDAVTRDEPAARGRAALALAGLGDARAVPELVALLYTDDEPTRLAAVDALGALRARAAAEPLLELLADDHVRYRVVLALGAIAHEGTFAGLRALARDDRADDTRANAAAALGVAGDRGAVALLVQLARDDAAQRYAVSALGRLAALGTAVPGWDARRPRGDGLGACAPTDDGPVWRYLDARGCDVRETARVALDVPATRAWVLVVRARGAGPLVLRAGDREIARLPMDDRWQEWRVPLAPDALPRGATALTAQGRGAFSLGHVALLPR